MKMIEDAELLRQYSDARCEQAFTELVRRYVNLVYQAALRQVGGRTDAAEDVTQSVFVLLARKAARISPAQPLAGWLHTTTRYVANDFRRAERRRSARHYEACLMHELSNEPVVDDWQRLRPVLDDALGELKPHDRDAILLRFFTGQSLAQIGARLEMSENAARMRIERALEQLRSKLVRRGVTSTAAALAAALSSPASAVPSGLAASVATAALAGAAGTGLSGGCIAGLLTFMNHAKITISVAAVLGVGGVGSALWEAAVAQKAENALRQSVRKQHELQIRLQEAERRLATSAQPTVDEGTRPSPALHEQADATLGSARAANGGSTNAVSPMGKDALTQLLVRDPTFQAVQNKKYRAGLRLTYGPFYRSLNLSAQQIAAFEEAMGDYAQANLEVAAVASEQGMQPSDPRLEALVKPLQQTLGTRLVAAIGAEGAAKVTPYYQTINAREAVNSLAGNLYYTDVPLGMAQADQLTRIVAANMSALIPHGLTATQPKVNWDAVLGQAQGVLAPAQLATLRSIADSDRYQLQLTELANSVVARTTPMSSADATTVVVPPKG